MLIAIPQQWLWLVCKLGLSISTPVHYIKPHQQIARNATFNCESKTWTKSNRRTESVLYQHIIQLESQYELVNGVVGRMLEFQHRQQHGMTQEADVFLVRSRLLVE